VLFKSVGFDDLKIICAITIDVVADV